MNEFEDDAVEIYYPVRSIETVGTCDGLVFRIGFEVGYDRDLIFVWNPATKEFKELPVSPNESESPNESSVGKEIGICGFGYDYKTDDYKSIESVPYSFPICGVSGVLVNGALHWLGHTQALHHSLVVVSLNVTEEKFEEMQLPKHPFEKKNEFTTMGVLEGRLCVVVNVDDVGFEVWRMQEYGVRESWNICHVITNERIVNDSYLKLVGFRNGEILFKIPGDLVFYDPKHRTARTARVTCVFACVSFNHVPFFSTQHELH
ncbi:F-box/kelch-repeat protein At3g06240-like [Papaver somniferum]|uniref:F-box/kelch-repeat protein At3g06240-like n=1 Tax=Papaver somniferum TaxID=3469 RepID=UPI000E705223|nr:F-box/kelch-repeat protein At3g06240-like [Papaver somniferum]